MKVNTITSQEYRNNEINFNKNDIYLVIIKHKNGRHSTKIV